VTWFVVAPHLPHVGLWWAIVIVSVAVMPVTLALVLVALPLWPKRWLLPAVIALGLVALFCTLADWGLAANFAKLWAAVFAGWAFLSLFEQLSWVVLVAFVIPAVDAFSVWRGPTKAITSHHFEVYTAVAIAFLNSVAFPLAREVAPTEGELQKFTPTIDALFTPDIDDSLDEQPDKTRFWNAFKLLGEWWASLPPY